MSLNLHKADRVKLFGAVPHSGMIRVLPPPPSYTIVQHAFDSPRMQFAILASAKLDVFLLCSLQPHQTAVQIDLSRFSFIASSWSFELEERAHWMSLFQALRLWKGRKIKPRWKVNRARLGRGALPPQSPRLPRLFSSFPLSESLEQASTDYPTDLGSSARRHPRGRELWQAVRTLASSAVRLHKSKTRA